VTGKKSMTVGPILSKSWLYIYTSSLVSKFEKIVKELLSEDGSKMLLLAFQMIWEPTTSRIGC